MADRGAAAPEEQGARLWSIRETAEFLQVPVKTLYQWRHTRSGPPSHRVGRHVRYVPAEVLAWVKGRA